MSAKFLYSLTDEKQDTRRQLGCMNGIFQLFDRHHFLAGRRASGHNHKMLPPGQNANHGMERSQAANKTSKKNLKEVGKEKQRVPVESSTTSFSSSCSSTFSSIDCNRTSQPELSSFSQSIFTENPSGIIPTKQPNSSSLHSECQSLDLRYVVKDSMYGEARGLSVKTIKRGEGMSHAIKHIDSPRPLVQSKSVQPRVLGDGSFQVLAKLRETSWKSKEEKDGSMPLAPKDAPRFSYDGRESRDKLKSIIKLKELPRLSLDSRERSIRTSASESRSNYLSRDIQRENGNYQQILNPNQEPGSNKQPSIIVARLMGLEAFPDSNSTDDGQVMKIKSRQDEDFDTSSRSSRTDDRSKQNQVSGSPKVSHKDPDSPQLRKASSVMKPTSSSRFPLEPAHWRQADGSQGSQKPAFMYKEAPTKTPPVSPSVYGDIAKRLTELEFKKSGKDLRALKQILEAMQRTRKRLENQEGEHPSNFESQTSKCSQCYGSFDQSSKLTKQQSQQSNNPVSPSIRGTSSPKRDGSPIVIIKPAKIIEKGHLRDLTPRNNHLRDPSSRPLPSMDRKTKARTLRSSLSSNAPQNMGENSTSFGRISGTVSPRLQQKKHGMEKQSRPTTTPSDLNRSRRQSRKQPMESSSPTRKMKPKSTHLQQGNDNQSSRFRIETRNSSYHGGDTVSVQSESNISLASQTDTEVTSIVRSNELNGIYQPKDPKDKNLAARLSEDRSTAELATATLEQPSPVSVLDAMFYGEELTSPVKKKSNAFKDDETLNCDVAEWITMNTDHLPNSTRPNLSSELNHNKLENVMHLIHKLRLVNSARDEVTIDHIVSLCENTTPHHRYITEILLASGFLKDQGTTMTTTQLHPSGHLINPNLFHVLEKIKGNAELSNDEHHEKIAQSKSDEKIRRKLVFDAVNEILVRKKALAGSSELWIFPNKPGTRAPSGEKLLKELWTEMDHLQTIPDCSLDDEDDGLLSIISADMMNQSEDWAHYSGEVPGLVLDIERLIFKDLISEVVSGGAVGPQNRQGRHCRTLFSK